MADYHFYIAIFALVATDYVTGIIGGCITDGFSSSKMREGLLHKFTYFIIIFASICIEYLTSFVDMGFVFGSGLTLLVCVWIAITEVGSIIENICKINPAFNDNEFLKMFANRKEEEK